MYKQRLALNTTEAMDSLPAAAAASIIVYDDDSVLRNFTLNKPTSVESFESNYLPHLPLEQQQQKRLQGAIICFK